MRVLASVLTLCAAAASQQAPTPGALPADRAAGAASIEDAELRQWLGRLASDEFAGRATGTEGFAKAAAMVARHFERCGLEPFGDADGDDVSYLQRMPWKRVAVDSAQVSIQRGDAAIAAIDPGGLIGGRITNAIEAAGGLRLLCVAEDEARDVRKLKANGDIVLLFGEDGAASPLAAALASSTGAAAVLAVDDERAGGGFSEQSMPSLGAGNRATTGRGQRPPVFWVGEEVLQGVLAAIGASREQFDGVAEFAAIDGLESLQAEVTASVAESEDAAAFNVVGLLRGSDPELADEYVVVGSHLDHLGQRGDVIYYGADDDASGTTGVLAVVDAFASNNVRPRRSLVFVTFCGEERGLLGSRYFVDNCPIPLESIVTEVQLDMIGRREEKGDESADDNINSVHLVGTQKLSPELHELCLARNEAIGGFDMEFDEESVFSRSDHANFARRGIPIVFLFTGFHPDYHQPTDTADKIDYDKLRRIAVYTYDLVFELAQSDTRPHVDPGRWQEARKMFGGRAPEVPAAPLAQEGV